MKTKYTLLLLALVAAPMAKAQPTSINTVGFVNSTFEPGDSYWFENPLEANGPNTLTNLLPSAPDGAIVALWQPGAGYSTFSSFDAGSGQWSSDFSLNPGTGALLAMPSGAGPYTATFTGTVLNFDGSLFSSAFVEPPAFSGPAGEYLLGSKTPIALSGDVFDPAQNEYSVFGAIVGRNPQNGEQFSKLDAATGEELTTTFVNGAWNNGSPTLAVGQAGLFNLTAAPEPSALALGAAALGTVGLARRKRS